MKTAKVSSGFCLAVWLAFLSSLLFSVAYAAETNGISCKPVERGASQSHPNFSVLKKLSVPEAHVFATGQDQRIISGKMERTGRRNEFGARPVNGFFTYSMLGASSFRSVDNGPVSHLSTAWVCPFSNRVWSGKATEQLFLCIGPNPSGHTRG